MENKTETPKTKKQNKKSSPTELPLEVEQTKSAETQEKTEQTQEILNAISRLTQQQINDKSELSQLIKSLDTKKVPIGAYDLDVPFDIVKNKKDLEIEKLEQEFLGKLASFRLHGAKDKVKNLELQFDLAKKEKNISALQQLNVKIEKKTNLAIGAAKSREKKEKVLDRNIEENKHEKANRYYQLIDFLQNKKELRSLTKGRILSWEQLLGGVPMYFSELIADSMLTYRDKSLKEKYSFTADDIEFAVEYMRLYPPESVGFSIDIPFKKVCAGAGALAVLVVVGIGLSNYSKNHSANPNFKPSTEAYQKVVNIQKSAIDLYESYFAGKDVPSAIRLEAKAITNQEEFYTYYAPAAIAACKGTGIFPEIVLAQGFHETGGYSLLFTKYNNMFGHKSWGWNGDSVLLSTKEYINGRLVDTKAYFRVYKNLEDGFKQHIKVFNKRCYKGIYTAANAAAQAEYLLYYSTARQKYVDTIKARVQRIKLNY